MAAIYYGPPLRRQERLLLYLLGFVSVWVPSSYGLERAYYGYTRYGPVAASTWGLPWFGLAGALFLAWLLLFSLVVRRARFGILLYKNGLRIGAIEGPSQRSPARQTALIPWEAVTGVAVEFTASSRGPRPTCRARLHLKGSRTIRLAEARSGWDSLASLFGPARIENLPELITRLKAHLYPRLYPALQAGFLAGQEIAFGPVSVQAQGMRMRRSSQAVTPWSEIRRVTVRSGELMVELDNPKKRNSLAYVPVSEIPNLELLLKLIEAYSC